MRFQTLSPMRTAILAGCLALLSTEPSDARLFRHVTRPDCNPTNITQKDIRGFHQVDTDLYRGARPTCAGYAKLAALGIRTIIDLQGGSGIIQKCRTAKRVQFRFVPFDLNLMETGVTGVPREKMLKLFATMRDVPKPIFLSCKFGEDRTGVVVALYRVKRGEMSFQQAEREALYYGFEPHLLGLKRTLDRYKDPREMAALPSPVRSSRPESACRAKV